jgi:TRAP-type C4-dicarboxylate transport system permease small subunit
MENAQGRQRAPFSPIRRIDRVIAVCENLLGITLVITVVLVVTLQIIFRFVLNQPLSWSGETATYILVWMTMLGMAIAQRERAHVAMQVLPRMPPKVQRVVDWLCWLGTLGMFLSLGAGGLELGILHHVQRSPATGLPIWVVYCALPVGGVLGLWHTLQDLPRVLKRGGKGEPAWP